MYLFDEFDAIGTDRASRNEVGEILRVLNSFLQFIERYTPRRRAQFLLQNAVDSADYSAARREVRKLGLDPDSIPHDRPTGA